MVWVLIKNSSKIFYQNSWQVHALIPELSMGSPLIAGGGRGGGSEKVASDLWLGGGFSQVLWFPLPLTFNWLIVTYKPHYGRKK